MIYLLLGIEDIKFHYLVNTMRYNIVQEVFIGLVIEFNNSVLKILIAKLSLKIKSSHINVENKTRKFPKNF